MLRCDVRLDEILFYFWCANEDVCVPNKSTRKWCSKNQMQTLPAELSVSCNVSKHLLQIEIGVRINRELLISLGADNFFDFVVDEVVEGINVLLDKAPDFEKSWQELKFVLDSLDGAGELFWVFEQQLFCCILTVSIDVRLGSYTHFCTS